VWSRIASLGSRQLLRGALLIAAAGVAFLLLWKLPVYQTAATRDNLSPKDLLLVQNQLRQTVVLLFAAVAIVTALVVLVRRATEHQRAARASLEVARDAQHAERLSHAIGLLADDRLEVRAGAVYALEQLAAEAPGQHWPIVEVLCAFVRDRAAAEIDGSGAGRPRTDVQAVLTVLSRRQRAREAEHRLDLQRADLRGADLNGVHFERAILREARLDGASLQRAHLDGADLRGAYLCSADLVEATLQDADLREAHLEAAYLVDAHLENADLGGAFLSGAYLSGAHLQGADLGGADLGDAYLYKAELDGAALDVPGTTETIDIEPADRWPVARSTAGAHASAPSPAPAPRHPVSTTSSAPPALPSQRPRSWQPRRRERS